MFIKQIRGCYEDTNDLTVTKEEEYFRLILLPKIIEHAHEGFGFIVLKIKPLIEKMKYHVKNPRIKNLVYLLYKNGLKVLKDRNVRTMVITMNIYWDDNIYNDTVKNDRYKVWNYFDKNTHTLSKVKLKLCYEGTNDYFEIIHVDLYDTLAEIKMKIKSRDFDFQEVKSIYNNFDDYYLVDSNTLLEENVSQKMTLSAKIVV